MGTNAPRRSARVRTRSQIPLADTDMLKKLVDDQASRHCTNGAKIEDGQIQRLGRLFRTSDTQESGYEPCEGAGSYNPGARHCAREHPRRSVRRRTGDSAADRGGAGAQPCTQLAGAGANAGSLAAYAAELSVVTQLDHGNSKACASPGARRSMKLRSSTDLDRVASPGTPQRDSIEAVPVAGASAGTISGHDEAASLDPGPDTMPDLDFSRLWSLDGKGIGPETNDDPALQAGMGLLVADSQLQMVTDAQWQLLKTAQQQVHQTNPTTLQAALHGAASDEMRCMQRILQAFAPEHGSAGADLHTLVAAVARAALDRVDEQMVAECLCASLRLQFLQKCCDHWSKLGSGDS